MIADLGVKRIEFIDDIFNVKRKDFVEFFNKVIQLNLKVKFFFPTALKGDLLDKESIDVMMQGGSIGFKVSLESANPLVVIPSSKAFCLADKYLVIHDLSPPSSFINYL